MKTIRYRKATYIKLILLGGIIALNSCNSISINKNNSGTPMDTQTIPSNKLIQGKQNITVSSKTWFRDPKGVSIETAIEHQGSNPQETIEIYRTVPFKGTNVVRISPKEALSALPNSYPTSIGDKYSHNKYKIIDSWKGLLNGNNFVFDIYQNLQNQQILIGLSYHDNPTIAKSIPSETMSISNFTGNDVVFSYGKQNNHWMAINLVNGNIRAEGIALEFSGCYPCHGGRPNWILGLNKKYPVNPDSNK